MGQADPLIDFFAYLERLGYEVTVNDFSGLIVSDSEQSERFATYSIHRNPFCMAVKRVPRLWDECLRRKPLLCAAAARTAATARLPAAAAGTATAAENRIRAGAAATAAVAEARPEDGSLNCWRGLCFCGREEIVVPVAKDGLLLATIALGGFATDRDFSLLRAHRATSGAVPDVEKLWDASGRTPSPSMEDAQALLGIAASEMLRLYENLEHKRGTLTVPEAARLSRERRLCLHAAEYLRRRMTETVPASELADACHVSLSTLSHVFKRTMGTSLRSYHLGLRIAEAKRRLAQGASVTEAALGSGFDDPNYFSRAFAASEGMPPSRWGTGRNEG